MNVNAPKPKIYLDTSVLSQLYATDAPRQTADTWRLWTRCILGEFDVCISPLVAKELRDTPEPKLGLTVGEMEKVEIETLKETDEVNGLAAEYIKEGILSEKSYNDCVHLAFASVYGCDALVSWNFRHLVRTKTIDGARVVNANNRYGEIAIVSPATLLNKGGAK